MPFTLRNPIFAFSKHCIKAGTSNVGRRENFSNIGTENSSFAKHSFCFRIWQFSSTFFTTSEAELIFKKCSHQFIWQEIEVLKRLQRYTPIHVSIKSKIYVVHNKSVVNVLFSTIPALYRYKCRKAITVSQLSKSL